MTTKVTWFFNHDNYESSDRDSKIARSFGWAESWYSAHGIGTSALTNAITNLSVARAALLGNQSSIVGYRQQTVDPLGPTLVTKKIWNGSTGLASDSPQQAMLFYAGVAGQRNKRQTILRGVPDARIAFGEYNPIGFYNTALVNYWALITSAWLFRGKPQNQPTYSIDTIDAFGTVITRENNALAAGMYVQILRSIAAGHRLKGATLPIDSVVDARTFHVPRWSYGASRRGSVRQFLPNTTYEPVLAPELAILPQIVERATGKPFFLSRGRRSAKYS